MLNGLSSFFFAWVSALCRCVQAAPEAPTGESAAQEGRGPALLKCRLLVTPSQPQRLILVFICLLRPGSLLIG